MLFDLRSGKRRRVVQIVFGALAALFAISFVGFGVGSGLSGGLFDALGIGGGSNSSTPQYDEQINNANKTLETNPNNERALLDLVQYHYLTATGMEAGIQRDPQTGLVLISDDAQNELNQSLDAWERYLKTKPKQVSVDGAVNVFQAEDLIFRGALATGDASTALDAADGAAEAQRVVADKRKTAADYGTLATYLYYGGQVKEGDAAAKKAVDAADAATRTQIQKAMKAAAKTGAQLYEQAQKAIKQGSRGQGGSSIENPFGGIGGDASATPAPSP